MVLGLLESSRFEICTPWGDLQKSPWSDPHKKRAPTSNACHFLSYRLNYMKIQTQLLYYILNIMSKHDGDQIVYCVL